MSGGIMRAVRDEMAAGAHWADWLRAGGTDRLARLKAFFDREASVPRHPPRFEVRHTSDGTPYQFAHFPQQPAPTGSAPAISLQPEPDATGRTVFRLRPVRAPLRA